MTRQRNYESTLPEGYVPQLTVDFTQKKPALVMNLAALAVMAVLCVLFWRLIRPWDALLETPPEAVWRKLLVFAVSAVVYLVLHELLHGAAYHLLTGHRLTFGLTWSAAYCGVPDIFVYRKAALTALLTPFAVFSVVFPLLMVLLSDPVDKFIAGFLLACHIGGCAGDLYDTGLYLFRFRDPATLMQDTGPKQTFYTKR